MESSPCGVMGMVHPVISKEKLIFFFFPPVGSKFSLLRLGVFDVTWSQINSHQLICWKKKKKKSNLRTASNLTIGILNRLFCPWREGSVLWVECSVPLCSAVRILSSGKGWEGPAEVPISHPFIVWGFPWRVKTLSCRKPPGDSWRWQTVKWGVCRGLHWIYSPFHLGGERTSSLAIPPAQLWCGLKASLWYFPSLAPLRGEGKAAAEKLLSRTFFKLPFQRL